MKSNKTWWTIATSVIFLLGCASIIIGTVSDHFIIGMIATIALWVISREISIRKCCCPYCGSKKTRHHICLKGSQLLCPECHHLIFYK